MDLLMSMFLWYISFGSVPVLIGEAVLLMAAVFYFLIWLLVQIFGTDQFGEH
jgi:hypothetical protein